MKKITLGKVAQFINGRAFKPTEWETTGIPIIRIQNLNNPSKPYNFFNGDYAEKHYIQNDDVLLSWSGTPGTSFGCFLWSKGPGVLNQHIFKVIIDETICDKNYFIKAVNSNLNILIAQAHGGVGLQHITKAKLIEIEIPLPPLPVQKKIAAILDAADALRQKDKALIAKYTELAQSLFLEMFGDPVVNPMEWEKETFGDYVVNIVGGESLSGEERPLKDDEIAVLKISAVTSGTFNPEKYKVIDQNKITKRIITANKGDLLFSRANTREMVGATCIVDNDYPDLCLPDKLWRLDLNDQKLAPHFVKFLLSHDGFRENLRKVATGTSGSMLNISQKKLKQLRIPLPPIELQTKFAERIEAIDQQKHQAELSLQKSEALFGSLMQKAFKGELVP